jgi:hypothetical protein
VRAQRDQFEENGALARRRSGRLAAVAAAAALLAGTLAAPPVARAYEEQVSLGFTIGYANLPTAPDEAPRHGVNGGLRTTYGLGDTWSLEARLEHAFFPDAHAPTHFSRLSIGATYALDVLRVVPFFGFGVGGALGVSDGHAAGDLVLYGAIGLDYLVSRRWLVGIDARVEILPVRNIDPVDLVAITAGLRAGILWDTY